MQGNLELFIKRFGGKLLFVQNHRSDEYELLCP
jgi:hypothetical protein